MLAADASPPVKFEEHPVFRQNPALWSHHANKWMAFHQVVQPDAQEEAVHTATAHLPRLRAWSVARPESKVVTYVGRTSLSNDGKQNPR